MALPTAESSLELATVKHKHSSSHSRKRTEALDHLTNLATQHSGGSDAKRASLNVLDFIVDSDKAVQPSGCTCFGLLKNVPIVPENNFYYRHRWVNVVLVFTLWVLGGVPVEIAFSQNFEPFTNIIWLIIDIFSTLVFLSDLILNFNVGFREDLGSKINMNRTDIAWRYLKTWFIIDAMAALPLYYDPQGDVELTYNFTRIFRMVRTLRVLRMFERRDPNPFAKWIKKVWGAGVLWLLTLTFIMLWLVHIIGCIWWYTGSVLDLRGEKNWIMAYDAALICDDGPSSCHRADIMKQYTVSTYFALTTLTTVGYGDISPKHRYEMWFGMACLLIGVLIYSLFLNSVSTIADEARVSNKIQDDWENAVLAFRKAAKLPEELQRKVHVYYQGHITEIYSDKLFETSQLVIQTLPMDIRTEVLLHMHKEKIQQIGVFDKLQDGEDYNVRHALAQSMHYISCCELPPDHLISKADKVITGLYFGGEGTVVLYDATDLSGPLDEATKSGIQCSESYEVRNMNIGANSLINKEPINVEVRSGESGVLRLYFLPSTFFDELFSTHVVELEDNLLDSDILTITEFGKDNIMNNAPDAYFMQKAGHEKKNKTESALEELKQEIISLKELIKGNAGGEPQEQERLHPTKSISRRREKSFKPLPDNLSIAVGEHMLQENNKRKLEKAKKGAMARITAVSRLNANTNKNASAMTDNPVQNEEVQENKDTAVVLLNISGQASAKLEEKKDE